MAGEDLYDALIDDYEPGMKAAELGALFDRMRPRLVDLRARIRDAAPAEASVAGHFPHEVQLALSREIALAFGYDLKTGRIDLAVHPFPPAPAPMCASPRGSMRPIRWAVSIPRSTRWGMRGMSRTSRGITR
jgi:hypothetical protein